MESERLKSDLPKPMESEEKRPDLCQFIDKGPIEIKKRLLEVPISSINDWKAEAT